MIWNRTEYGRLKQNKGGCRFGIFRELEVAGKGIDGLGGYGCRLHRLRN